jgi:Uma2 family endonuclease
MNTIEQEVVAAPLTSPDARRAAPGRYTAADLLTWTGDGVYELVNGHIVEKPMGNPSGLVTADIASQLNRQLEGKGLVFSEGWLRCFPRRPKLLRRPDVVFAAMKHFPEGQPIPEAFDFPPELAVEVTSPKNTIDEIEDKLEEYLEGGIPITWVAHPPRKLIRVFKPGRSVREYGMGDTIDPEPQLPGLLLRVADVFKR